MTSRLARGLLASIRTDCNDVVVARDELLLQLPERVVQFGTGALLRGFIDDFLHRANAAGSFNGRIVAIASAGSARHRAFREQEGLYTLVVEGIANGQRVEESRIISSVSRAIAAIDEWPSVLALARVSQLEYVFSNTTEVGIAEDADSGFDDAPPKSFPAKLTRFLFERARHFNFDHKCGLVVIPCELIENNGDCLRGIVLSIAERWALGTRFIEWIGSAVPFCNTLVDRIVPGTPGEEDIGRLRDRLGYDDALLTCCEPYCLFAIEGDEQLRQRMTWTSIDPGIIVTPDIAPYRKRKVHLLNGAHSLLAPAALQMGCETVLDAMNVPAIARFARRAMLDEIVPTLNVEDAAPFADAVLDRFRNPFIKHALIDITLQATMKIRVRVVPSIQRYVELTGRVPAVLSFGFAAFLLFMQGGIQAARRAKGLPVPVDDRGAHLHSLWNAAPTDDAATMKNLVSTICSDATLWGTDLTSLPGFRDAVANDLMHIRRQGMATALDHLVAS